MTLADSLMAAGGSDAAALRRARGNQGPVPVGQHGY